MQQPREFWIDVGGTFTDCIARMSDGALKTHKLLSSGVYYGRVSTGSTPACIIDPNRMSDPPGFFRGFRFSLLVNREGVSEPGERVHRSILVERFDAQRGSLHLARPLPTAPQVGQFYELSCDLEAPLVGIHWLAGKMLDETLGPLCIRLGTTHGTNSLLERRGAPTAFVTTLGFGDLLLIGDQTRPRMFDLQIRKPSPLYRHVIEVNERLGASGDVLHPLDKANLRQKLLAAKAQGIRALAVSLMNSYRNPAHELMVEEEARAIGFEEISLSSRLSPLSGLLLRSETTVINAYLGPAIRQYVGSLKARIPNGSLQMMTSAGSLVGADEFVAKDSILSGPAGGVVGCAAVARQAGYQRVIGFDMGGTSTDVCRFDGDFERRYEMSLEDRETGDHLRIVAPMLAIETVAAGGGSICDFDGAKPIVGPRSAGANPGPACYGRGGPLCLTDANLYLGRITRKNFPFPLDRSAVEARIDAIRAQIKSHTSRDYSREELALGYVTIANAHMVAAIRQVSIRRGYDPRTYALVSFGGAGGQHACSIARQLGIRRVVLPNCASVLSAYGIGMADITSFEAREVGRVIKPDVLSDLKAWFSDVTLKLRQDLLREGILPEQIDPTKELFDMRYVGQSTTITVQRPEHGDWRRAFEALHEQLYGFTFAKRHVEISAARAEVSGRTPKLSPGGLSSTSSLDIAPSSAEVFFDRAFVETPIYLREALHPKQSVLGPALILDPNTTIVVEPDWRAELNSSGDVILDNRVAPDEEQRSHSTSSGQVAEGAPDECDPITLELFNNIFSDIAGQMGITLQRTALSTNVKERLDYSCAVFDASGDLVAHAPHIPVHLGSMGQCVKCLIEDLSSGPEKSCLRPGEVYVTNDPYRGGTHLPDVTVITPVFDRAGENLLFFAASRAHHAEIGGITPGSMPPRSRSLSEEGVLLQAMRILEVEKDDHYASATPSLRDDELRRALRAGPHPSRAIDENIADIHAQAAANHCGARLLHDLVARYGVRMVNQYMRHLRQAAEKKMRSALLLLTDGQHRFTDYMDDGAAITVNLLIRGDRAVIDFTGTDPVLSNNLNATPAIVTSAVLYCFRCLIEGDILLNAGTLKPLSIILPECLLNPPAHADPSRCAAVAGGNVETSQRIVDVIFGALGIVAAAQGTMNNIAFGSARFGYYETIGGGAGAGPKFHGAGAVHTHMTNTRLTDPEVFEDRYPVRLRRFAIRRHSGGEGRHHGGDGIIREIEFTESLSVSLLTQRRLRVPYGLAGGQPGQAGRNTFRPAPPNGGEAQTLPPICELTVGSGDVLTIETPGGGGYGQVDPRSAPTGELAT